MILVLKGQEISLNPFLTSIANCEGRSRRVLDSTALDLKGIANIAFRDVIPHVGSESLCPRDSKGRYSREVLHHQLLVKKGKP